jgi:hypothetical protein
LLSLVNNYWNNSNWIKEVERPTLTNKILENENKELLKEIEKGVSKNEVNRFALLLFVTILILIAYGLASVTISILKVSFKK